MVCRLHDVADAELQKLLARGKEEKMQKKQGKAPNLLDNSKGLLGYGVPMSGLRNDSLLKAVEGHSNHQMIKSISLNGNKPSDYLIELAERFKECSTELPRSRIYYFYETKTSIDKRVRHVLPNGSVHTDRGINSARIAQHLR